MEFMPADRHRSQLIVTDLHAQGIDTSVQLGVDRQARAGGGARDEVDDDLVAFQRAASPVGRYRAEQPVLDLG